MKHRWEVLEEFKGRFYTQAWPTIPQMLHITVSQYPDRPFLKAYRPDEVSFTFLETWGAIRRLAGYIAGMGIHKGDKVAVNGKNSPEWALAYFAVLFAGAIVVPVDNQMDDDKMAALLPFADCKACFFDPDVASRLKESHPQFISSLSFCRDLAEDLWRLDTEPIDMVECSCDDVAALLFTSGTTGNEKAVILTHANITSDVYQACDYQFLDLSSNDVMFAILPLHHSYCCTSVLLECAANGCCCLMSSSIAPTKMIKDMKRGHVTFLNAIPIVYTKFLEGAMKTVREKKGAFGYWVVRLLMFINGITRKLFGLNHRKLWFKPLIDGLGLMDNRVCICGAGPLSSKTFKAFQQLGINFIQGYGLTETSPILTLNPVKGFKIKSVGKVFPLVQMRIDNPDFLGVGEVVVKGPNVTQGYYKDPANTKALFTEDGYLRTGDLGSLKRNYLYLKGRAKNLIVTEGGKNVYPEEIEDKFQLCPAIAQIMVRGYMMNKSQKSEGIEAVIYPSQDFAKDKAEQEVKKAIEGAVKDVNIHLPGYKKISKITILDKPMVMTSTRKIQRNKVLRTIDHLIG